jgi:hypothetical protein
MISHKYKFIFTHIPRTSGSSIEEAFGYRKDSQGRKIFNGHQDHRTIKDITPFSISNFLNYKNRSKNLVKRFNPINYNINKAKYAIVNQKQFNLYFKFTVVRNPFSRVYSWYNSCINGQKMRFKALGVPQDISLNDFIYKFAGHGNLKTQMDYITDYNEKIPYDFIGRFEDLDLVHRTLKANIYKNAKFDLVAAVKNKKVDPLQYRKFYNSDSRKFVEDFYSEELNYFNYDF